MLDTCNDGDTDNENEMAPVEGSSLQQSASAGSGGQGLEAGGTSSNMEVLQPAEADEELEVQQQLRPPSPVDPKARAAADMREFMTGPGPDEEVAAAGCDQDVQMKEAPTQCTDVTEYTPVPVQHMDAMDSIRAYCTLRSSVSLTDAMAHFMAVPTDVLEAIFLNLADEGIIQPTQDPDTFIVLVFSNSQAQAEALHSQPSVNLTQPQPQAAGNMGHVTGKLTGLSLAGTAPLFHLLLQVRGASWLHADCNDTTRLQHSPSMPLVVAAH